MATRIARAGIPAGLALLTTIALVAPATVARAADPYASAPPYLKPVAADVIVRPIVTTGQQIPLLGGAPGSTYRVLGLPDGMGASGSGNALTLLVNHEFSRTQGTAQGPLASGARVSRIELTATGGANPSTTVIGGELAFSAVYNAAGSLVTPGTARLGKFCSSFLATPAHGFDREVLFSGEEATGSSSFDGLGGMGWATFDGTIHAVPRVGRAPWENVVVLPGTGTTTALLALEDGPSSSFASQLCLYVGTKVPGSPDPMLANGLSNGALHVLAVAAGTPRTEGTFATKGASIPVVFAPVNWNQNEGSLETEAQSKNSFNFVRLEDGTYDRAVPGRFWFVSTGSATSPGGSNPYGRLYRLDLDPTNPAGGAATLTLVLDGSEGMVSPDNVDQNEHGELAICEDPNYDLPTRDSRVWLYDVNTHDLSPLAEVDQAAANAHALAADPANVAPTVPGGDWEESGIVDGEPWFGRGSWIVTVQAHSMRIQPSTETVQGGQILLVRKQTTTGVTGGTGPSGVELTVSSRSAGTATLEYTIPSSLAGTRVALEMFDVAGRRVALLADGPAVAGTHRVSWTPRAAASGLYFARLTTVLGPRSEKLAFFR